MNLVEIVELVEWYIDQEHPEIVSKWIKEIFPFIEKVFVLFLTIEIFVDGQELLSTNVQANPTRFGVFPLLVGNQKKERTWCDNGPNSVLEIYFVLPNDLRAQRPATK